MQLADGALFSCFEQTHNRNASAVAAVGPCSRPCATPRTHIYRTVLPHCALCCRRTVLPAEKYEWITKRKIGPALGFVEELEQRGIPYWLRYVLMPGTTDGPEDVAALLGFCRGKRSMQAIEVLPYHLLGLEVGVAAPRGTA